MFDYYVGMGGERVCACASLHMLYYYVGMGGGCVWIITYT